MFFYILRRITLLVITLLVLTLGAYLLEFRLIGQVLDFWHGYPDFLQRIVEGDFGLSSVSGLPVLDEIRHYFPATLTLCLAAFAISLLVGIPLGTLAALYQGRGLDLSIMAAGLIGYAVPVFWLALLMVMFFSLDLGWLPSSGQISLLYDVPSITGIAIVDVLMSQEPWREAALHDALRHLVLPSLVLAVVPTTEVIRHVRSSLIDVMKQNYIKAAASRGLSRRQIVWRHGLKNALPPVLPLLGLQLGSVLTSAMITEVVFDWPGIGRWLVSSIALQDYAAIRGAFLVVASFVIFISVSTELLTTIMYPARRKELYAKQD
ncbi:ABC transporter permease [Aeromonas media]|uniref:ABC transporter permease subunit n=1 Tax=Aeromonas media TaxID=651 RepID=A0AAW5RNR8_AERME|nr:MULTISPECIES: ABC transporter permease subunit [Aeromonas]AHX61180.1 peptide ABC transporter, permease protein SapB [Aeromonas media WS]MBV7468410.1 ABC transporter permease subunit [Aeromonas sp. sif0611]MCV3288703.1 ABC transporter permease subunit [Aeromonas media]MCY9837385.1 ABC transporter permease subunit [Aeromonas media]BBS87477.1 antimicrobial peptide ABC transporter permease SapB [Aeromonas media]